MYISTSEYQQYDMYVQNMYIGYQRYSVCVFYALSRLREDWEDKEWSGSFIFFYSDLPFLICWNGAIWLGPNCVGITDHYPYQYVFIQLNPLCVGEGGGAKLRFAKKLDCTTRWILMRNFGRKEGWRTGWKSTKRKKARLPQSKMNTLIPPFHGIRTSK